MKAATLCHPIVDGELLLIRKQRGIGAGKLVGPGGKIEPGEIPREAACRELREELHVSPIGMKQCGEFAFHLRDDRPNDDSMVVSVFVANGIDGEPVATEEAVPVWHSATELPYDEMWPDDRIWIPHMLDGDSFRGTFVLSADGGSLLHYEMELDVDLGAQEQLPDG